MAGGAVRTACAKLVCVRILVAVGASRRYIYKLNMQHGALQVRRPVAVDAGHGPMRTDQRETSAGMIETREVRPPAGRVTGFTTLWLARLQQRHACRKLPEVDVLVACRATQLTEVKQRNIGAGYRLVALVAGNRHVPTCKWEVRLLM